MGLMKAILKKVKKKHKYRHTRSLNRHDSPPPDISVIEDLVNEKKPKKKKFIYEHVGAKVDSSPPRYDWRRDYQAMPTRRAKILALMSDNIDLLAAINKINFNGGRVDSHWRSLPPPLLYAYYNRMDFLRRVQADNKMIYQRLITQGPKVASTESLNRDWVRNKADILARAQAKFVLFPPVPIQEIEDPVFIAPAGVKRPRVYLRVGVECGADVGELCAELFADVCPHTCRLFTELLAGDGLGHSYVGTHFYRKVPGLYWAGGDVIHDNGFGCYKQRGRRTPIAAENFHFPHSMPGLLSMVVACDDQVCGMFNITFKPLRQFDLKNVVFGRIIRPSPTLSRMYSMGRAMSPRPAMVLRGSRLRAREGGAWTQGTVNTRIAEYTRRPRRMY